MAVAPRFQRKPGTKESTLPAFTVTAQGDIGPFKQAALLVTVDQIGDYFRLVRDTAADDENDKTPLTNEQIYAIAKDTEKSADMSAEQWEGAVCEAMDTAAVPPRILEATGIPPSDAEKLGELIGDALDDAACRGVEGKKDYEAAPIYVAHDLAEIIGQMKDREGGPLLDTFPVMGTRRTGGKRDTTVTLPDGTVRPYPDNLPTDWYKDSSNKTRHWTTEFCGGLTYGAALNNTINWLTTMGEAGMQVHMLREGGCPDDLIKYHGDPELRKAKLKDVSKDRQTYVNRISRAIRYLQKKREMSLILPQCYVHFVNQADDTITEENAAAIARMTKPLRVGYETMVKTQDGTEKPVRKDGVEPYSLSQFISMDFAKANQSPTMQKDARGALLETLSRGTKKGAGGSAGEAAQVGGETQVKAIENVDKLGDVLSALFDYVDKAASNTLVRARLRKGGEDGGLLASRLVEARDALNTLIDDSVQSEADAYDKRQRAANAKSGKAA